MYLDFSKMSHFGKGQGTENKAYFPDFFKWFNHYLAFFIRKLVAWGIVQLLKCFVCTARCFLEFESFKNQEILHSHLDYQLLMKKLPDG